MSEPTETVEPVVEPVVEPTDDPIVVSMLPVDEPTAEPEVVLPVAPAPAAISIPITNTVKYTVTSYKVEDCVSVVLNQKAIVYVLFFTDNGITFRRTVELTGANYDAWTSDDNYIYTYVNENVEAIFHSESITF